MNRVMIALVGLLAFLFGSVSPTFPVETSPFLSELKTPEGIPYLSGGVSQEERKALDAMGKEYNLKLLFSVASGAYLANVDVQITDPTGKKVLEAQSKGPWFYTKLPAGTYRIEAKCMDQVLHFKAQIPGKKGGLQHHFRWKE